MRFDADTHERQPEPPRLTDAELHVLSVLDDLSHEFGHAPTFTQMLERLGWSPKSRGSLHQYIERLRKHGVIAGRGRGLRVAR